MRAGGSCQEMDRRLLSHIDEELESSEVAELCFLCSDVINRKRLEGIKDAKGLFTRLEEKGLLDNTSFLSQLLQTIHRADLLNLLEADSREQEERDACPVLSQYRVMLYKIHGDMTEENLEKMKYLLKDQLGKRQLEKSSTALDVFAEMEKIGLISKTNVDELHRLLLHFDQQLAVTVQNFTEAHQHQQFIAPARQHQQRNNTSLPQQPVEVVSVPEMESSGGEMIVSTDSQVALPDETEYYRLVHNPRGLCVILNNEDFTFSDLKDRSGTQNDVEALDKLFTRLGFRIDLHNNLTGENLRCKIAELSKRDFSNDDILVVCILSHGDLGCVYGTDGEKVALKKLISPFVSDQVIALAGKPKLFFIQACQGEGYQKGTKPFPGPQIPVENSGSHLEADCGFAMDDNLPVEADFLIGMATVQESKSFRHTGSGSIYIQELCKQLSKSAESPANDDILTVLTRVNREVGKGVYLGHKQMPEPRYTLTKKLVLRYVEGAWNQV